MTNNNQGQPWVIRREIHKKNPQRAGPRRSTFLANEEDWGMHPIGGSSDFRIILPSRLPSPSDQWHGCNVRSRLQRRVRRGFSPHSKLRFPCLGGRSVRQRNSPMSSNVSTLGAGKVQEKKSWPSRNLSAKAQIRFGSDGFIDPHGSNVPYTSSCEFPEGEPGE